MQFNKHAVVCCMDGNVVECRSLTSFRGGHVSHYFLMLSLSFNINFDDITVLKQSANRAIIRAKILFYAPRARFPHSLEAFPSSSLMTLLPASKIVLM